MVEATLDNGLQVYVYPLREVPLFSARLVVSAGSAYDPPQHHGLAALTARLLARGTPGKNSPREEAERLGAALVAASFVDEAVLRVDGLSRDRDALLNVLARAVASPSFSEEEAKREAQKLADEDELSLEDPVELSTNAARAALFAGHPYAFPALGIAAEVRALHLSDVTAFHQAHYTPQGAALVIVGDVDPNEVIAMARGRFSSWKERPAPAPLPAVAPLPKGRRVLLVDLPSMSADVVVAAPARGALSPEAAQVDLLNDGLGGGFTSKLLDELRVNRGLVYDVSSSFERHRAGGWFSVQTSVPEESARDAVDIILKTLANYRALGPSREDLQGAQTFFLADSARDLEAPAPLADLLSQALGDGSGIPRVAAYQTRLRQFSLSQAAPLLQDNFPNAKDDVLIVVVGDASRLAPAFEGLGPVSIQHPRAPARP
jgi:zinc protease